MSKDRPQGAAALCSVCEDAGSRYKCPRCLAQTCSLACCRLHKEQSGCSGREDLLAHLRQGRPATKSETKLEEGEEPPADCSSGGSDSGEECMGPVGKRPRIDSVEVTLDARFLSHVQERLAGRPIAEVEPEHHHQQRRPAFAPTPRQRDILRAMQKSYTGGAYAVFLPPTFERAKMNRSRAVRNNSIAWTVELAGAIRHDVLDSVRLGELLPNQPMLEVRDENPGVYAPRWKRAPPSSTIREALAGVHVVEFPVFRACR